MFTIEIKSAVFDGSKHNKDPHTIVREHPDAKQITVSRVFLTMCSGVIVINIY